MMKKNLYFVSLLLLISSLCSTSVFSQNANYYTDDINGLILSCKTYSTQDIINKFGQPSFYEPLSEDTGEGQEGRREFFKYNDGFNISLNGYGEVSGAFIASPQYTLFKGYLQVGNPISKLNLLHQLGVGRLEQVDTKEYNFYMGDNYLIFKTDNANLIVTILYFVPF